MIGERAITDDSGPTALFIGAHPDDIELGAGGTVLKLRSLGWQVFACILTKEDDSTIAIARRDEATQGLGLLGVPSENIIFTDFPDGKLDANKDTIGTLRQVLSERRLDPTLVFTHTEHENHNDHRAAHALTLGTFRRKAILCYGIVKSMIASAFMPRIFTDTSIFFETKLDAFKAHTSQLARISLSELEALDAAQGNKCGFAKSEGFELILQQGALDKVESVRRINDCPFHRFWYTLIGDDKLVIIHAIPVIRPQRDGHWPIDKDREGIELLQRAFARTWSNNSPIEIFSCATPAVEGLLEKSNVLLSGGSVSNSITRDYFDHFVGPRYHIHYEMPGYRNISIWDRKKMKKLSAQYREGSFGTKVPLVDLGILTVMRNPINSDRILIGCMGVHGYGSLACYRVLADRRRLDELMELIRFPVPLHGGYQVLVEYHGGDDDIRIKQESLHSWTAVETQT